MSNSQAELAGRLCFGSVIWLKPAGRMSGASVDGRCWLRLCTQLTQGFTDVNTEPGVSSDEVLLTAERSLITSH